LSDSTIVERRESVPQHCAQTGPDAPWNAIRRTQYNPWFCSPDHYVPRAEGLAHRFTDANFIAWFQRSHQL